MRGEESQWLKDFNKLISYKEFEKAANYLTQNYEAVFSIPSLHRIYSLASQIPDQYFVDTFPKLLLGWLCFVCGDNKRVNRVLTTLKETELKTADESSSYYGLKAMTSIANSQDEGLRYAKLAVDVLPKDSRSFIAGNAHMTYGQILASINRYRDAAEHFGKGFKIFNQKESSFLAINCFVNECLNLYALGLCREVIGKCQKVLVLNSSKNVAMTSFMNIIKLPMGMCYYEMNKISLALEVLESAKSAIVDLKLVHMHGLIEWYLFECYRLIGDEKNMIAQIESLESAFSNLHHPQVKCFVTAMRIVDALSSKLNPNREWIEELELAYELNPKSTSRYLLGVLIELSFEGYSQIITEDIVVKELEELRFIGNIPEIQSISLYLSEIFLDRGNFSAMKVHLKTACDIYKQYGLMVQFVNKSLKCYKYLEKINSTLSRKLPSIKMRNQGNMDINDLLKESLTNRELEIINLIAEGKSNREIAQELFISIGTIKWHINNIFGKLQVKKRFEAIQKAKELNLL